MRCRVLPVIGDLVLAAVGALQARAQTEQAS